ncbi:class I SAM-dependent methyltransferase [Streptomyces sp. NRRL F-5126]|uniref:class I SAM-dependent methyltransferase n=1 Tax=Streptomyces sp. NRRL F-5126 TaxID=1463857 RepID=UPI0004C6794E|nr:class I SAM-dependent methyltransferase [Streptomyces sp. NRRL F-5126]
MPTLPPERPRPVRDEPHRLRTVAESFGSDPGRYDRSRPRYPAALIERIAAAASAGAVLDVGCGTGIAARQLKGAGCRVRGVEPDERMAAVARQDGIEVDAGRFEEWDPAGRVFDAVVAGQAWHWVDPAAGAAQAARVLAPGGRLTVFWNAFQLPLPVAEAVAAACERVMPGAPFDFSVVTKPAADGYRPFQDMAADGIRRSGGFGDPELWRFDWERRYTREEWLEQMPTQGAFTRLAPGALAEVLAGAGSAIDALGGAFTMPYATLAVSAERVGSTV